ncbi:unnamed protein product [Arctogadus glacialis]
MRLRLLLAATAVLAALLVPARSQETVDPPSELKFKILNENTVQMTWVSPLALIDGYRIQVTSDTEELDKQLELPASATKTSITELIPDVDYTVIISSYEGARESLPLTGRLTIQSSGATGGPPRRPKPSAGPKCSVSAVADVVFVVDGSGSVGQENFKHLRSVMATVAGAFEIGADKTRVAVVQYGDAVGPRFSLRQHLSRGELVRAINAMPFKGGEAMTGAALDYVLEHSFSEAGGARPGFPKVAVVIGASKSRDSVEVPARRLRGAGVEVFVLGIKEADAEEMTLMASTPHSTHVYSVVDFEQIKRVHKALVTQVCASVDDQLSSLVSGEEVVEPANNLQVLEFASKSMRLTWDPSFGDVSGYKVQVVPMMSGPKRQELYVGHAQTSLLVRDLAPDTEYQISVFALDGLTPSEAVTVMGKTESVQVSLECSLGMDVQADVVLLVDGSYSIGLANFAKVRAFLEVLVKSFDIGPGKVQISLVQYSRDPHTEFHLNTHHDLDRVVAAVRSFPYRGGSTNTGRAMTYVREKIFLPTRGARASVPRIAILITDGKSSDAFKGPATLLRSADVEVFAVGVKEAVRSELVAIANAPADTHVYTVDDFDAFQRISKELTQSICLRIEQELRNIQKRKLLPPRSLSFSEVGSRSFRASWVTDTPSVQSYLVQFRPADDTDGHFVSVSVPGDTRTSLLPHLSPDTRYEVHVVAQYDQGDSFPVTEYETTLEDQGPVRGLRVSEETTDSFRVSWLPAPGAVLRYRLSYEPTRGDNARLETTVPRGGETTSVLQRLLPRTTYRVTVTPEYAAGDGPEGQAQGTTKEARGSPRDLRVSDETATTMRLGWAPAPGSVAQYRVSFRPLAGGGPRKEVSVKGENTALVLKNLQPGTQYELSVRARYRAGLGDPLEGSGTTLPELTPPRDLVTDDVTPASFSASWTPAPGPVQGYRVLWRSLVSQEAGEKTVPGDQSRTPLEGLTPETLYQVSVVAVYPHGQSPALLGQETTDASCVSRYWERNGSTGLVTPNPHFLSPLNLLPISAKPYILSPLNPYFLSPLNLLPISVNPYILSPLNPYFLSPHHPLPVSANPYILSPLNPYFLSPHHPLPVSANPYILSPLNPYFLSLHHPLPVSVNPYILSPLNPYFLSPHHPLPVSANPYILSPLNPYFLSPHHPLPVSANPYTLSPLNPYFLSLHHPLPVSANPYILSPLNPYFLSLHHPLPVSANPYILSPLNRYLLSPHHPLPVSANPYILSPLNPYLLSPHHPLPVSANPYFLSPLTPTSCHPSTPTSCLPITHFLSPLTPYFLSPLTPTSCLPITHFLSPHHPLPVSANPYFLSTAASAAGKALVVTEETESTMRVTWTPAPGKVSHYRLRHVSQGPGGREVALKVPGSLSSTVMKRLQPMTTYDIEVHPMYRHGEGKARQGVGTTLSPYKAPRNLQTSEPTKTSFRVSWDHAPGDVKGYKVTFHPIGDQVDLGVMLVGPHDNTIVLEELRAGTEYSVAVSGVFDNGVSLPLAGEEKTTLVEDSEPSLPPSISEAVCKTKARADIILLVDGSWSIGRLNFKTIRSFIGRMVGVFDIGPERVQIGVAQYSGDPKTMWHLNEHPTRDGLLKAVANLPYKGGNTMTGMALNFILKNNFQVDNGMRPEARKIGVLITDGKSQDEIIFSSQELRDQGIELYAVGVKNADVNELRSIASEPEAIHMYNVKDFSFLLDIVDDLSNNICNSVKGPAVDLGPPSDLVTSEATHYSFRASWTAPEGEVDAYRVMYQPTAGGPSLELRWNQPPPVRGLADPLTSDSVSVYAVLSEVNSEPLTGTETTLPLSAVRTMDVLDETTSTMRVRWEQAAGASGYRLLYRALNASQPAQELEPSDSMTLRTRPRRTEAGSRVKVSSCSHRRVDIRRPEVARAAILFVAAPRHRRVSGSFRRQRVADKVLSKPAVSERLYVWKNMWHNRAGLMEHLSLPLHC